LKLSFIKSFLLSLVHRYFQQRKSYKGCHGLIMVKHLQFASILLLAISLIIEGCKKKNSCETIISKGRIIGYDPCRYYTPSNKIKNAGFVIEIDNGTSKDTVVNYSIPQDLFDFPDIDGFTATNGQFLYPADIQEKFKIKFNYRVTPDNEMTAILCNSMVFTGPFYAAVKDKEIVIFCISKQ
jgi:hypothetical protein